MENLNRRVYFGKAGIYRIFSTIDDRCYIGSSNNLYKRINGHINNLISNKSCSIKLQNFYNKYGENSLDIEILEICSIEILLKREAFYIDKYDSVNTGFNCTGNLVSPFYIKYTEERYNKLIPIWKQNGIVYKDKLLVNLEKARQSLKDNPIIVDWWIGRKHSEESKIKQSISAEERGVNYNKPVIQLDKNNNFMREYSSAREAERIMGIAFQNIGKCCLKLRKTAGGFKWMFVEDKNTSF